MKIYDVTSHKSFEIDPNSINLAATKRSQSNMVWLHESSDKWNTPYACGALCTSEKTWKKIVSTPRSKLN